MNLIEIFYIDEAEMPASCCSSCSSGCGGCDIGGGSIEDTIRDFRNDYDDEAFIKAYKLTDQNADDTSIRLQEIYVNSGETLIITPSNIKFILSKLTPIIAIDGELVKSNYVPTAVELKMALD